MSYLDKFKKGNPNKNNVLAEQIFKYFNEKIPFPRIMAMINQKGYQAVYEAWNDVRQSSAMNPIALFFWKIKNITIKWQEKN